MSFRDLLYKKSFLFESIGFENSHDFFVTIFGIKEKNLLPIVAVILSAAIAGLNRIIDAYIFTPAAGVWLLFIFTLTDAFLGVAASKIVKKESIDHWRLTRAGARFIFQIFATFGLFQISQVWLIMGKWTVDALLLLFVLTVFWSGFKNAHKLKLVSDENFRIIEGFLSIEKVFKRMFGDKIQTTIEDVTKDKE